MDIQVFGYIAGNFTFLDGVFLLNVIFARMHFIINAVFRKAENAVIHEQQNLLMAKPGNVLFIPSKIAQRRPAELYRLVQVDSNHFHHLLYYNTFV